jgi:hypothetical protein
VASNVGDRAGRDRAPTIPGHEVSGVIAELGYGTTELTVGQRVFELTNWTRNGTLAEYVAVEARNVAPVSAGIDHTVAAALPISGLTAWQGLFDHGRLATGQTQRRRFNHEADIKPGIVDAGLLAQPWAAEPRGASRLVTQRGGRHDCLDASCVHVIDQPADDQRGGHEWVLA